MLRCTDGTCLTSQPTAGECCLLPLFTFSLFLVGLFSVVNFGYTVLPRENLWASMPQVFFTPEIFYTPHLWGTLMSFVYFMCIFERQNSSMTFGCRFFSWIKEHIFVCFYCRFVKYSAFSIYFCSSLVTTDYCPVTGSFTCLFQSLFACGTHRM